MIGSCNQRKVKLPSYFGQTWLFQEAAARSHGVMAVCRSAWRLLASVKTGILYKARPVILRVQRKDWFCFAGCGSAANCPFGRCTRAFSFSIRCSTSAQSFKVTYSELREYKQTVITTDAVALLPKASTKACFSTRTNLPKGKERAFGFGDWAAEGRTGTCEPHVISTAPGVDAYHTTKAVGIFRLDVLLVIARLRPKD